MVTELPLEKKMSNSQSVLFLEVIRTITEKSYRI